MESTTLKRIWPRLRVDFDRLRLDSVTSRNLNHNDRSVVVEIGESCNLNRHDRTIVVEIREVVQSHTSVEDLTEDVLMASRGICRVY